MAKKEVREDTQAWFFAAKLYVTFVVVFVSALGFDIYRAVKAIGSMYTYGI